MIHDIPHAGNATAAHWKGYDREALEHPERNHPGLVSWLIERYSRPLEVVYDPMAGAGTVIREAHKLGRLGYGWDIVPEYRALYEGYAIDDFCGANLVVTSPDYYGNHPRGNTQRQRDITAKAKSKAGEGLILYPGSVQESKDLDQYLTRLFRVLFRASKNLASGGYLIAIVRNRIKKGREFDLRWLVMLLIAAARQLEYVGGHSRKLEPTHNEELRAKKAEKAGKPRPLSVETEWVDVWRKT